ncbi:MAG: fasciclin domain-containing protein [Cyanobacteria bacterium J06636_16]
MIDQAVTNLNQPTIAGIVTQSGGTFDSNDQDFDILLTALQTANLVAALDDPNADLTVFAPTDAAFVQLAQDFGYTGTDEAAAFNAITSALTDLGNGDPVPLLTDILLYHVLPSARTQAQLQAEGPVNTLLTDASFTVQDTQLVDNEPDLVDPNFVNALADIPAANGVIQGIDRVLIPLDIPGNEPELITIAGIVAQSGGVFDEDEQDFDILLTALQTADLVAALDDPSADLTVLAPTDAAFVRLAQDLGYTGTDEAEAFDAIVNALTELGNGDPVPLLTDILLYHVSPEAQDQSQLRAQGQVSTLLEGASFQIAGELLIDNDPDLIDPRFERSLANIQAENGLIQGIDRVLIPLDIPASDAVITEGNADDNFLFGLVRSVSIRAGAGNDTLLGSGNNDLLRGQEGNDILLGNDGNDILRGGPGNDRIVSGQGDNLIRGGSGDDLIFIDGGRDIVLAGIGADTIVSESADSLIDGGADDDLIFLHGEGTIVLRQGNGTDTIQGFTPGESTFSLGQGLTFSDLSFQQGSVFSTIAVGEEILAQVVDTTADALNSEANFV